MAFFTRVDKPSGDLNSHLFLMNTKGLTATKTMDSKKKRRQQRRHRNSRTWSEVERRSSISEKMSYLQSTDSYGLNVNVPVPVCPPPQQRRGGTHSPGGEGCGGSIFWKTRDIGLSSYSNNLSTLYLIQSTF